MNFVFLVMFNIDNRLVFINIIFLVIGILQCSRSHFELLADRYVRSAAAKCADVCARETCNKAANKSKASRLKLDKELLQDPYKVELFQREINKLHAKLSARCDMSAPSSIDAVLSEWNTQVAIISRAISSPPRIVVPKKSWISP